MTKKTKGTEAETEPLPDVRKGEPFDYSLPVELKPAELQQYGRDLGASLADLQRLDTQLEEAKGANKASRKPVEAKRDRLAEALRSGKEYRDVRFQSIYDYVGNTAKVVRLDTDETVSERPLTEAERQREIEFAGDAEPGNEFPPTVDEDETQDGASV